MIVSKILGQPSIERLLHWQLICFFLAVLLLPFAPPVYTKSFLGSFSQVGHLSSLPILIGVSLACISLIKEGKVRNVLCPAATLAFIYMIMIAAISIHSITGFDGYTQKILGVTPKILVAKQYLAELGITDEKYAYQLIVFIKDIRNGLTEIIYTFGFVAWTACLYVKEKERVFLLAQRAILCDFLILAPYVATELFHLYGCRSATEVLKFINPLFYVPFGSTGWYPPLVSWGQIRCVWTEPAYFSIWLAFAVPYLFYWATKSDGLGVKRILGRGLLSFVVFSVWFMTYARTSVYLAFICVILSFVIALYIHTKESRIHGVLLITTFALAFVFVSNFGPADIAKFQNNSSSVAKISSSPPLQSSFIQNTVKSAVSAESRSTPSRIQYWIARLLVFKDSPFLGKGDSFEVYYETKKYSVFGSELTPELKNRLKWVESNGIFNAGFGGTGIAFTSLLACRGLLGFAFYVLPILLFFFFLAKGIHRATDCSEKKLALCLFCSTAVVAPTFFVQGLNFLYFWCSCGVGVGWMLSQNLRRTNVSPNI